MDPATISLLTHFGLAIAGAAVGWYVKHHSTKPTDPVAAPPGHITIGHGALLQLLLGVLSAVPAPTDPPSDPAALDVNGLLAKLLQLITKPASDPVAPQVPKP